MDPVKHNLISNPRETESLCSGSYNDEDVYLFSTTQSGEDTDFTQQYRGHRNNATVKENICITLYMD